MGITTVIIIGCLLYAKQSMFSVKAAKIHWEPVLITVVRTIVGIFA